MVTCPNCGKKFGRPIVTEARIWAITFFVFVAGAAWMLWRDHQSTIKSERRAAEFQLRGH